MNKLLYFTLCIVLVLSCSRCKEKECTDSTNPDCPNYVAPVDPCEGKTEVNADFVIEERISPLGLGEFIPTDTTLKERNVRFSANFQGADEYKWYIGTEIIHDPSVMRYFPEQWAGSNIPITLVVRKVPDNACFPNDDGYDSITKIFHVSNYPIVPNPLGDPDRTVEHGGLQGTYRLIQDGMQDSIDVGVSFCDNYLGIQVIFENLDGLGTSCPCNTQTQPGEPRIRKWSYRYAEFGLQNMIDDDFCNSTYGILDKRMNGDVYLNVESRIRPNPQAEVITTIYQYKGRKIN